MRSRAWITSSAFVVFGLFERVKRVKQKTPAVRVLENQNVAP